MATLSPATPTPLRRNHAPYSPPTTIPNVTTPSDSPFLVSQSQETFDFQTDDAIVQSPLPTILPLDWASPALGSPTRLDSSAIREVIEGRPDPSSKRRGVFLREKQQKKARLSSITVNLSNPILLSFLRGPLVDASLATPSYRPPHIPSIQKAALNRFNSTWTCSTKGGDTTQTRHSKRSTTISSKSSAPLDPSYHSLDGIMLNTNIPRLLSYEHRRYMLEDYLRA
jgi:hypothetical protein